MKMRCCSGMAISACLVLLALPGGLRADAPGDVYSMDETVVVADRTQNLLRQATGAASVLTAATLRQLPARNLSEALKYAPGLTFVDRDGSGSDPMAVVRGFYGGGETEYVLLLIDGTPANNVRTGLAEWGEIPIAAIERIEILRGGGSSLYGDAALGAVVNVITRAAGATQDLTGEVAVGDEGRRNVALTYQRPQGPHLLELRAASGHNSGFRAHSEWENLYVKGRYRRQLAEGRTLAASWAARRVDHQDPGPLTADQVHADRTQGNPFFTADRRERDVLEAQVGYVQTSPGKARLSADVGWRSEGQEQTRTLLLAPQFGTAQFHDEAAADVWGRFQYDRSVDAALLIGGLDVDYGSFDSEYYDDASRAAANGAGDGHRLKTGLFGEAKARVGRHLRVNAGLRYDRIGDSFTEKGQAEFSDDMSRWSPHLGTNYAYCIDSAYSGNVYASWNRAFKAPTLDQRFDLRQIPTGQPGVSIGFSTPHLSPQRSTSYEAGVYQRFRPAASRVHGEVALSAYRMDLKDEIDFDLSTFKYGNIQESRHDGVESSATLYLPPRLRIGSVFNHARVVFRSGENLDNRLKNIPRNSLNNKLDVFLPSKVQLTLGHNYIGEVFLDDANTVTTPSYHTVDAKVAVQRDRFRAHVSLFNLADKEYNSSGYVLFDQGSMANVSYLFPAQGRSVLAGIDFSI